MTDDLKNEMSRAVERLAERNLPSVELKNVSDETTVGAKLRAAYEHAPLDGLGVGPPFATLKRVVRRALRATLARQSAYNRTMADAVSDLNHQLMLARRESESIRSAGEQQSRRSALRSATLETQIEDGQQQISRIESIVRNIESLLSDIDSRMPAATASSELENRLAEQHKELGSLQLAHRELTAAHHLVHRMVQALVEDLRRTGGAAYVSGLPPSTTSPYDEQMYQAFEDEYRGSSTTIAERLQPYVADVIDLKGGGHPVIDLGAGRAEWLRVLRDADVPCIGYDKNERFVHDGREAGLHVELGDAIELLSKRPPRSVGAVTAFHLVEHLSVEDVGRLISASFRALLPGGVLIIETPNASNLMVGASSFYRDPTHVRPMHPDFLVFLMRYHGFVGAETRYLHPADDFDPVQANIDARLLADLQWALYGPQDFAVLARKPRLAEL